MLSSPIITRSKKYLKLAVFPLLLLLSTTLPAQTDKSGNMVSYLEALNNFNLGNEQVAEKQFKEIVDKDKNNDAALFYLANINLNRNNIDKAQQYMVEALKIDPNNNWYKQQLAKIYTFTGKNEQAIALYNQLREEQPLKSESYDALIELYISEKNFIKADEVLQDIEKSVGVNEATALTRFNLLIFQQKQEEAYNYLEKFDQQYGTARTSTILGDNYAASQNDSLAQKYYSRALNLAPDYQPANFGLAEIYRIQGKYALYFEKMYPFMRDPNVDPSMKTGYMQQILTNRRFIQTFLPQIDSMMHNMYSAHSSDSSIAYSYSLFLVQSDKSGKALDILHNNLKLYPQSIEAHRQYLSLIYYLEMWEPLIKKANEALLQFPNNTDFLQFKGIGLLQTKKLDESIATFKEVLKHSKGDSTTMVNTLTTIADLSYEAGRSKEAYKYYQKTIKKEPNHFPALNNYAYYLALEGKNLKKAYRMSKITIEGEPNNPTYLDTFAWILHLMNKNIEAKAVFKHAMLYGGKESAAILDHYSHVLWELKEYDLAFLYWDQANKLDPELGIKAKVQEKKQLLESNH
ncbi:MAG: tetratricopeptide repeat protein [Bacteroidales bacterium]|nr:tetratricopeptide repeat protein [Bacteroidales bacterium]